ncbi:MAG: hypothetical protein IJ685_01910 [Selenomonadaceae bacterium]|nr:hypothetical protein [Selenomonadaceae bacterium]
MSKTYTFGRFNQRDDDEGGTGSLAHDLKSARHEKIFLPSNNRRIFFL